MKTVIIAGSGCNNIGWKPIDLAIRDCFDSGPPPEEIPSPTFLFSLLSYQLRTLNRACNLRDIPLHDRHSAKKEFNNMLSRRSRFLDNISKQIKEASEAASLNYVPDPTINSIFYNKDTSWLTLNWDNILERDISPKQILHIHGSIENPETLLLPTEVSLLDLWMPQKNRKILVGRAYDSLDLILAAERIIFWGCSLDIYDAEIQVLIAMAIQMGAGPKELIVVDKNKEPATKAEFLIGLKAKYVNPILS